MLISVSPSGQNSLFGAFVVLFDKSAWVPPAPGAERGLGAPSGGALSSLLPDLAFLSRQCGGRGIMFSHSTEKPARLRREERFAHSHPVVAQSDVVSPQSGHWVPGSKVFLQVLSGETDHSGHTGDSGLRVVVGGSQMSPSHPRARVCRPGSALLLLPTPPLPTPQGLGQAQPKSSFDLSFILALFQK